MRRYAPAVLALFAVTVAVAQRPMPGVALPGAAGPSGVTGPSGPSGPINSPAGQLVGASFNSTADQGIPITIPAGYTKYLIQSIAVYNASTSLTTAAGGLYPTTSKGGTAFVASGQTYSSLTGSTISLNLTLTGAVSTTPLSATTLYLSLTTPQGSAATANVVVNVNFLP